MADIMVKCPIFGMAVPTGITTEMIILDTLDFPLSMHCPACKRRVFNDRLLPRNRLEMCESSHTLPEMDTEQLATKHSTKKSIAGRNGKRAASCPATVKRSFYARPSFAGMANWEAFCSA